MNAAKILVRMLILYSLVIFLSGPVVQAQAAEGDSSEAAVVSPAVEKTEADKPGPVEETKKMKLPSDVKQIKNKPSAVSPLPGAKWWIPAKPYKLWKKDHLEDRLRRLEEYKTELAKTTGDPATVAEVEEQIKQVKIILARIW